MNELVLYSLSYPVRGSLSSLSMGKKYTIRELRQGGCGCYDRGKEMFRHLREDIQTILAKDPAASSLAEVLTYAGFWALFHHRIAHRLYQRRLRFLARAVSQW